MRKAIENKIITIIGMKRYGKTTKTEIEALKLNKPTIIADPRGQFEENVRRRMFKSTAALFMYLKDINNRREFYRCKLELVVRVKVEDFDRLVQIVYNMRKIVFVVDEIDMFAPTTMTNKAPFYHLIHYGGHTEIDIITTSRRPANISRNLTSQTDITFFTRIRENGDKDYIKHYIGKEYVDVVAKLEKYEFLYVNEDLETKIIQVSKKEADLIKS